MAQDGMWTLTDEGVFVLEEPYATKLKEARTAATAAWATALIAYLFEQCPYTVEELRDSLLERCDEEQSPNEIVDEFILEALSGDL